jgi:GTP-binding protein EngB required for normal cell division
MLTHERGNWQNGHSLHINETLAQEQKHLLGRFGRSLLLGSRRSSAFGVKYWHWFITDGLWVMEFGGGELQNAAVHVHCNPLPEFSIEKKFTLTSEVRSRMEKVCGSTGYSIALRNCEHLSRYVASGTWLSLQTLPDGAFEQLRDALLRETKFQLNTLPRELELEAKHEVRVIFDSVTPLIASPSKVPFLQADAQDHFNILLLGPTGCGKSHIVNLLFNQTVSESKASARSVSRNISIFRGQAIIAGRRKTVNVVDPIGFCDTLLSTAEVIKHLKDFVKTNLCKIDAVLICCSGRIQPDHALSINQFQAWLNYKKFPLNFTYAYTHADDLSEAEKENACAFMASDFAIQNATREGMLVTVERRNVVVQRLLAVSFSPRKSHPQLRRDLDRLWLSLQANQLSSEVGRISIDSSCVLL